MHGIDDNPNAKNYLMRDSHLVVSEILENKKIDTFLIKENLEKRQDLYCIENKAPHDPASQDPALAFTYC